MVCHTYYVMQRIILGIVGIIVILILGGKVLPGIVDETASESYSENFAVTTGASVTTANVTLSYSSYYDDRTGLSVTSGNLADSPMILFFRSAIDEVEVGGLHASDTRILTIGYSRESGQQFYGFGPFMRLLPFLVIIGGIIACLLAIYGGIKSRG